MNQPSDLSNIRLRVIELTCRNAFEKQVERSLETVPYEISPGIAPRFRCCVYREREIVRQRVRMTMGRLPHPETEEEAASQEDMVINHPDQIVHVIPAACEGCTINRFTVTNNCQNCLTRNCLHACAFGAILHTPSGALIDQSKCKECGQCVTACPYNAIVDTERPCKRSCPVNAISMDHDNIARINNETCINCGACIRGCPFGAISDLSDVTKVVDYLLAPEKKVYALVAPSIEGQFGEDVSLGKIKAALITLGFDGVYEVAVGADATAYYEAKELVEHLAEGKKMTSSCCPGFTLYVEKNFPTLVGQISTTPPPMMFTARHGASQHPDGIFVFIGPCVAKKHDIITKYKEEIQATLTFDELAGIFLARSVHPANMEDQKKDATKFGRGFAKSGGVTAAVKQALSELGHQEPLKAVAANGIPECKKQLTLLKVGKLDGDFIEGMACTGGCLAGPGAIISPLLSRKAFDKLYQDSSKTIVQVVNDNNL